MRIIATIESFIKIGDGFSNPLNKFNEVLGKGMNSLNKMKSSLHFNGDMKPPTEQFNGFNNSLEKSHSLLKSMVGANLISGGISKGIGLINGEAGSMINELNESSKAWQTFDGNMKMFGASQSEMSSAKKDMQQYAQATIYSSSDMASTYSQLRATGVKNTGQLVKGFGGLAASAQDPVQAMKTLSQQGTQMAAKPTIQWQDLKLMMEQAPAGISAVAKNMHMSATQMLQDVQKGKIKTQDFFNAVAKTGTNKQFTHMATNYKTVGQAMDGLRETLANQLQPAFDKVGKVGIKAISGLIDKVGDLNFNKAADNIAPVLQGTINTIVDGFNYAKGAVGDFFEGFKNTGAIKTISSTISTVKSDLSSLNKSMSSNKSDPFAAFKSIGKISGGAIGGLAKTVGALADDINKLNPGIIKSLALAFIALKFGMKGLVFTAIIGFLNVMNRTNPQTARIIAGGILVLVGALAALKTALEVKNAWNSFKGMIGSFKTPKVPKTPTMPQAPTPPAGGAGQWIKFGLALILVGVAVIAVATGFYIMVQASIQLANAGWGAIAVMVGMIATVAILGVVVSTVGTAMIAGAVGFVILGVALLLIAGAVWIVSSGMTMLAGSLPTIAQYGLMASVGILELGAAILVFSALAAASIIGLTLFSAGLIILSVGMTIAGVAAVVLATGIALVAGALMLLGMALTMVGNGLTTVAGGARTLASTFTSIIGGMITSIGSKIRSIPGIISNGISSAVSAAKGFVGGFISVGADLMAGLAHGIASGIGATVNAAKNAAGSVVSKVKGLFHIGSPSKLFYKYGGWLNAGLANGINANSSKPVVASGQMSNNVIDATQPIQNGIDLQPNSPSKSANLNNSIGTDNSSSINSKTQSSNNSKHDYSINIAPGAIQINSKGNSEYDAETLVNRIENYLKTKSRGALNN
ncbi:hypothetical protein DY102_07100 [Apilactobacillus timberlakei]|nr:hypothetical protein DY102_07100 [Apilactobacillus timberlakei]